MIAFGWVVWKSAPHRTLHIVGALLTPAVGDLRSWRTLRQ
jgi:hypothetical protein